MRCGVLCAAWLGLLACSRHDDDRAVAPRATSSAAPLAPRLLAPSPSQSATAPADDVEDRAVQHITEQNLESELDRLEREIQAE